MKWRAERQFDAPRRRGGALRRGIARVAIVGVFGYSLSSIIEAYQFQREPTKIIEYQSGTPEQRAINQNSICLDASGLGTNLTHDYYDGTHETFAQYCRTVQIIASNAGIEYSEQADKVNEFIEKTTNPSLPVDVYMYGGSMGGLANIGMGAELTKNKRVNMRAVFLDSTPTGPDDTKGALEKFWVESGSVMHGNDWLGYGMKDQSSFLVELLSNIKHGSTPQTTDDWQRIARISSSTDRRLYLSQLAIIESFKSKVNLDYLKNVPVFYLHAANPDDDPTVDVAAASQNWKSLLPQTVDLPVVGGKHANPNPEPGNQLGIFNYNQEINAGFRTAGAKTPPERLVSSIKRLNPKLQRDYDNWP